MASTEPAPSTATGEKQCRICFDGEDPALGRLIRPCLCKGTISHVHVKCLQQWRKLSTSKEAFFVCPQCHYRYHFARTKISGLASNPVMIGMVSTALFTLLCVSSSFITTRFLSALDDDSYATRSTSSTFFYSSYTGALWSPVELAQDLLRAVLRIMQDSDGGVLDVDRLLVPGARTLDIQPRGPPGLLRRFVARFLLGLPVVGVGSLVHMLLSVPFIGPLHWIARWRGFRRSQRSSDIAALVVVILVLVGAARTLYKVYNLTQKLAQRVLLRAEDAILEVS